MRAPVIRVDKNNQHTMFNLSTLPGVKGDAYVFAYATEPGGQLVALMRVEDEDNTSMFVAGFSSNGEFAWKSRVSDTILPASIEPLPSGDLLISGIERNKDRAADFVRIYSRDGTVKNSLFDGPDLRVKSGAVSMPLGASRVGRDEQIYVLRGGTSPRLEVYTLTGEQQRVFNLGTPYSGAQAFELYLSASRALVSFQKPAPTGKNDPPVMRIDYMLYDLSSGSVIANFVQVRPGVLACVSNDELTWLVAGRDGFFEIRTSELVR